jgi:hypothetical protein
VRAYARYNEKGKKAELRNTNRERNRNKQKLRKRKKERERKRDIVSAPASRLKFSDYHNIAAATTTEDW